MPARSTMAVVGFNPKVRGSSRLIPARGPTPGRRPTRVPTTQPTNAYSNTEGDRAVANPFERFCSVSIIGPEDGLESERSPRQGHF
jgi:hypothetical protein